MDDKKQAERQLKELLSLGLNKGQAAFLLNIAAGEDDVDAYLHSHKCSRATALTAWQKAKNKILQKPKVLEWFEKHDTNKEKAVKKILTIDERKKRLTDWINDPTVKMQEKLKALDILNKMEAVYERRTKVEGDVALTIGWAGEDDG